MKTLIVVDMQKDFIDGALGTKEAVSIVAKVKEKIEQYHRLNQQVIFTRDTHGENYLDTKEGKNLPVKHCIKGSSGWQIADELIILPTDRIINKQSFGYDWSSAIAKEPNLIEGAEIELVGLCTDICVISNAMVLKTIYPEKTIKIDADCCAGVTVETHKNALLAMKMCQIQIENE